MKDAEAVGQKLESLEFKVECAKNPGRQTMLEKLDAFLDNINESTSDIVIYYAGHGCNIRECSRPVLMQLLFGPELTSSNFD